MSNGNNSIPVGDVQFLDNYVPPLEANDYTISVTQTVSSTDSTHPLNETFNVTQDFSVLAPRFALPAADVQSVFPPANATGIFDQNLPHVVLTQRALPWERLINEAVPGTKGTPWMALLLLMEDEIIPPGGTAPPSVLTNPTLVGTYPVTSATTATDSLLKPTDPQTLGPQVTPETEDETTCNAIDISTDTFTQLAPRLTELPFLAHVRDVNAALQHKTTDIATANGWFSVVIGNRFPAAPTGDPPSPAAGVRNIVHLVSLEGFDQYLVENPTWPAGITKVRLASLLSWSFTCLAETGNFATLMNNLVASPINSLQLTSGGSGYTSAPNVSLEGGGGSGAMAAAEISNGVISSLVLIKGGAGYTSPPSVTFDGGGTGAAAQAVLQSQGGDMLRLRLPVTSEAQTPQTPAAYAQTALQQGYAALAYDTRVGDQTLGWYHGPFVPNPIEPLSEAKAFESSASATVYDQQTGTFDLSYAAAWELGRLLALSDRAHSTDKMRAQKALRKIVNLLRERTRFSNGQNSLAAEAQAENATALREILRPKHVSRSFVSWLGSNAGKHLPKPGVKTVATQQQPSASASLTPVHAAAHLRALHERADVQALMNRHVTAALAKAPLAGVVNWQAGLRLLNGVPFAHLIPDARMLPPESIRFFYVDPNYLDALCDGANSIGVQTTRDATQHQLIRGVLRDAAIQRAHKLRANQIKRPELLRDAPASDPVTGLLLRSAVVSGWPGLEVKAYQSVVPNSNPLRADLNTLIPPVRMDRLAPDVLLCLYPQIPAWIEFDEPKEGLAFGVEDADKAGDPPQVALRYLDNTDGHMGLTTGTNVQLGASYMRDTTSRVINMDTWQAYLSQQVPASDTKWGPAAFAIQMVRAPEQMIFQNQLNPVPEEI